MPRCQKAILELICEKCRKHGTPLAKAELMSNAQSLSRERCATSYRGATTFQSQQNIDRAVNTSSETLRRRFRVLLRSNLHLHLSQRGVAFKKYIQTKYGDIAGKCGGFLRFGRDRNCLLIRAKANHSGRATGKKTTFSFAGEWKRCNRA